MAGAAGEGVGWGAGRGLAASGTRGRVLHQAGGQLARGGGGGIGSKWQAGAGPCTRRQRVGQLDYPAAVHHVTNAAGCHPVLHVGLGRLTRPTLAAAARPTGSLTAERRPAHLRKLVAALGQSSTYRSTIRSPLLVSMMTLMAPLYSAGARGGRDRAACRCEQRQAAAGRRRRALPAWRRGRRAAGSSCPLSSAHSPDRPICLRRPRQGTPHRSQGVCSSAALGAFTRTCGSRPRNSPGGAYPRSRLVSTKTHHPGDGCLVGHRSFSSRRTPWVNGEATLNVFGSTGKMGTQPVTQAPGHRPAPLFRPRDRRRSEASLRCRYAASIKLSKCTTCNTRTGWPCWPLIIAVPAPFDAVPRYLLCGHSWHGWPPLNGHGISIIVHHCAAISIIIYICTSSLPGCRYPATDSSGSLAHR